MEMVSGDTMKVKVDKQGRIVMPKKVREKYHLSDGAELEMISYQDRIELIPLIEENDPAVIILKEPCETGDSSRSALSFSRERVWR